MTEEPQPNSPAQVFMKRIRQAQRKSGKTLAGRAINSSDNFGGSGIIKKSGGGAGRFLEGESGIMIEAVNKLAVRFDEMCRRQGAHHLLTEKMSADIVQRLAWELKENTKALESSHPENFISVTLYNGKIVPQLISRNPFFENTFAFNKACQLRPLDPQSFLTHAKMTAQGLIESSKDPQSSLSVFRGKESTLVHAVLASPNDPRRHLKRSNIYQGSVLHP